MLRLFIDSGPFIARHNIDDDHHKQTLDSFDKVRNARTNYRKLYTSDYVLDESVTTCRARTHDHRAAVDLGTAILGSKSIVLLRVQEQVFNESWQLYKSRGAELRRLSFTDFTTAILAKAHGIVDVYTFDKEDFQALNLNALDAF